MPPTGGVVITGIGMVTPLGATAAESAAAWREGRSAPRKPLPELAGTSLQDEGVALCPAFDAGKRLGGKRMLKYMSDAAVLGCVSAREAALAARMRERFQAERIGLFAGSGLAAASVQDVRPMIEGSIGSDGAFSSRLLGERGLPATNPLLSFRILANMPPCLVSIMEGVKGRNLIFTPWEGQTGAALVEAWRAVSSGAVDCALAGAGDNPAHASSFVYLRQGGWLREAEYPAAGAAYLVLEREETAQRDGQPISARVKRLSLDACSDGPSDPLSERLGRTFAAAPAILLALACLNRQSQASLCGADGQRFSVELEFGA